LTEPTPTDIWENLKVKHVTSDVPIVISSDEFSCQKAIYFAGDNTIADVLKEFIRKSLQPVSPLLFGLYVQNDDFSELALNSAALVKTLTGNPVSFIFTH
jgi:hypothetical protein